MKKIMQWLCGLRGHRPFHTADGHFECWYCRKKIDLYRTDRRA